MSFVSFTHQYLIPSGLFSLDTRRRICSSRRLDVVHPVSPILRDLDEEAPTALSGHLGTRRAFALFSDSGRTSTPRLKRRLDIAPACLTTKASTIS